MPTSATTTTPGTYTMPSSATPTQCAIYLPGHAVQIAFASTRFDVAPACQNWIESEAAEGTYWTLTPSTGLGTDPSDLTANCTLMNAAGGVSGVVDDEPAGFYGQQACSQLVAAGWIEEAPTTGG
jgi:hypothetical protein